VASALLQAVATAAPGTTTLLSGQLMALAERR
jgi:hypothetical protein